MMIEKKAMTSVAINDLIARRWSGRAYDPDKKLEKNDILPLLEAARWAPSCYGDEPWRFIVFDKHTDQESWQHAFSCLAEGNQQWAINAPVLMLSIADSLLKKNDKPNRFAQYDTGAAAINLCLQATDQGLMVHQMGGFDADKARSLFNIPERYTPMAMMTLGYQLPLDRIEGEIRERELSKRQRTPLQKQFFSGSWGEPFPDDV